MSKLAAAELLSLATRHHQAGELAQAEALYRQLLQIEPHHPHGLHQLGVLATQAGQPQAAIQLIESALRADGSQAMFYVNLGEAHRRLGDVSQAIAANERALELMPSLAGAHANLGLLHEQLGDLARAVHHFRQLVELVPGDGHARALLARALLAQGNLLDAEHSFRHAVRLAPNEARAHYNLGAVLQAQNRLQEAAACYRAAIAIAPGDASAHNNLGGILQQFEELDEAVAHYRIALASDPRSAEAHSNLAAALVEACGHEDALVLACRAIELAPDFAGAHRNAALALQNLGRLDEAIREHRRAIELAPDDPTFYDGLLYLLNFLPGYDAAAIFAEHRAWATRFADPLTAGSPPHANERSPERRLRIGYVSPYFLEHAVNFFVEPILTTHDHAQVEVFCYSDARRSDVVTARLRKSADHWRQTAGLGHQQLSDLVRDDRIDILVDLTGHIGGSRLLSFARRPAPVQVTYIGYQNTTGMLAMDYRLTDAYADPPGLTDAFSTEKLVRLPTIFFCYLPSRDAPPVESPPAIRAGHVTFGAFHNFTKVTPWVLQTWARILSRVPRSRLMILADDAPSLRTSIAAMFDGYGLAPDRQEFVARVPRGDYLARMGRVDVALDSFPFNGHTTTCDCLWQGVPVVSLSGQSYASRFGGSGLVTLGLGNLIAQTPEQYVDIAADLAADIDRLVELRSGMRERMAASPLLDFETFTRNLEAEYRRMWTARCAH